MVEEATREHKEQPEIIDKFETLRKMKHKKVGPLMIELIVFLYFYFLDITSSSHLINFDLLEKSIIMSFLFIFLLVKIYFQGIKALFKDIYYKINL